MPARNPFSPPPSAVSLYVHVPFCENKCNYCAFESRVPCAGEIEDWLYLLKKELAWWGSRIGKPKISTCYVGGGTPTVLNGVQWIELCALLEESFDLTECDEITVEANPNSLAAEHLHTWRDWRVTRVSIGVQSFDESELTMLGRLHTPRQAYGAISAALAAGFSVSADFMFGLPYQTLHNWARTLREAVSSGINHISVYQLSIEPGTPWENLDDSILPGGYSQYRWAQQYLPRKGFEQYEIANFARAGKESRHNLNYWLGGEYIGVGPAASGYIGGWRYKNLSERQPYADTVNCGGSPIAEGERLSDRARSRESAILALRTFRGINRREYEQEFGLQALAEIENTLKGLPVGLYDITRERIVLTKKGMRVANRIWVELI